MKNKRTFKVGTRGSKLALVQCEQFLKKLRKRWPEYDFEKIIIKTKGDKIIDTPLSKIGDKGLFTKEIEKALLDGSIDMAVHSLKDLPAELPGGLYLGCVPEREDPRDAFVSVKFSSLEDMPLNAKVGTSSLRRKAQLLNWNSRLQILDLRGNVDTRLKKLDSGNYDAIVLAAAGLKRLGFKSRIKSYLTYPLMISAVGQGALGIETRQVDEEIKEVLSPLNHMETLIAVTAERAFLKKLEGGCQVPLAARAVVSGANFVVHGIIASLDGSTIIRETVECMPDVEEARKAGTSLANRILDMGGDKILESIKGSVNHD